MKRYLLVPFVLAASVLAGACASSSETAAPTQTAAASPTDTPTEAPAEQEQQTIIDNDELSFIITGTHVEKGMRLAVDVYVENKTEQNALFTWEDVSVDDFMNDPFWAVSVPGGKKAKETIYFFDVTEARKIDFTLLVMPEIGQDTYDRENALLCEAYTFEP